MAANQKSKRTVTPEHKKALAAGRDESRIVRRYLEAIDQPKRRGRQRTAESIRKRLSDIDGQLSGATTIRRLQLIQEKEDLERELGQKQAKPADIEGLRRDFVKVAQSYGERKGISYASWRKIGVDAATLKSAGIGR